jgi:hypothetical protein
MNIIIVASILIFLLVLCLVFTLESGHMKFLRKYIQREDLRAGDVQATAVRQNGWIRRPLLEKGRPFLKRSLLFFLFWIVAMAVLVLFSKWIGFVVFAVVIVISVALVIGRICSHERYMVEMVLETACPQCGKCPMDYEPRSRDDHRLLKCNNCHIEWDLGSL